MVDLHDFHDLHSDPELYEHAPEARYKTGSRSALVTGRFALLAATTSAPAGSGEAMTPARPGTFTTA
jgi:hypothetical protein